MDVSSQGEGVRRGGIAAAHHRHGLAPIGRAVTGGAVVNALANECLLAGDAQGAGCRAGGDDHRAALKDALAGLQGLAIACAIFSGRRILILDEPTSGLDGQNMRLVAEKLKSEARNGRTILVLTHDRELIENCCDNVVEVEKRSP